MKNKSTNLIAYVGIVLVVIILVGVAARFTNGFTDDFKTFYIKVEDKEIMSSSGGYEAYAGGSKIYLFVRNGRE